MKRREVIKRLSVLPVAGAAFGATLPMYSCNTEVASNKRDLFDELGVKRLINCSLTKTFLSGSIMLPEVLEAIDQTSGSFANMHELQDRAGEKIAEMLECEAAMVTSGAAGGIVLGTAATMTGTDPEKINQLPDLPGPKREVIIQKSHRSEWDQLIRVAGAKLVEVDGPDEMEKAINKNTVMAFFLNCAEKHSISHEEFVAISKEHNIVSFNDCAADVPPVDNLFKYIRMGFDLVTFSGGKMMHGPQSTGLLFGRKDLIRAARLNNSPHECPVARPMKVNKEEIFGMYVALKSYLEKDHEKEWQEWLDRINYISEYLKDIPTLKSETVMPTTVANAFPSMKISWDQSAVKITLQDMIESLLSGNPGIYTTGEDNALEIHVILLQPRQVKFVAQRIKDILGQAVSSQT